ncbi:phosphotransferase [Virgibacillus kekensis]|uniref:Phosphotransferase n=1 Tax=Virgibacillus kekensis TaxID=202261 RepID=A0ABV9DK28_9BACI
MDSITEIAKEYGIRPYHVNKITEKVHMLNDGRQRYVVKRSNLTEETLPVWERVYHEAAAKKLAYIAPVCLTNNNKLYVEHSNAFFYMSPWLADNESSPEDLVKSAMDVLGRIHATTANCVSIQHNPVSKRFKEYQQSCEGLYEESLHVVVAFEKQRYMSPFELLACTQFRIFDETLKRIGRHTADFLDNLEEDPVWNYSLCHGKPDLSHVVRREYTCFVNWDNAGYENPVFDLIFFIKSLVRDFHISFAALKEATRSYLEQNRLSEKELHLAAIHLLNPFPYIKLLQHYAESPSADTMVNQTKTLKIAGRELQFGLDWSEFVYREIALGFDAESSD